MRRIRRQQRSKRAITLVELIVAMTLTMIFAGCCIMLIMPVSKIYMHANNLSRAQIVADSVVDALRAECSRTSVTTMGDVWITNANAGLPMETAVVTEEGPVLVIRKNLMYCETLASNYEITDATHVQGVNERIPTAFPSLTPVTTGDSRSRAIYFMFPDALDAAEGYVHFGYYESGAYSSGSTVYVLPQFYYDFTSPFSSATYGDYVVSLNFHHLTYDTNNIPAFVECDVKVQIPLGTTDQTGTPQYDTVYTRTTVLCFS